MIMLMKLPGTNQYIDKYKYERQDTPHTILIIFMRINKRETYVQHYLRASHVRYILIYLESALNSYWSCGLILSLHPPPTGQDGRYFADAILKCIFVNEKCGILITISLKFVPNGPIDNNPAFV